MKSKGQERRFERDLEAIQHEKMASTAFRQAFRIGVGLLFSTKVVSGVGGLAEVHRQRDVARVARLSP